MDKVNQQLKVGDFVGLWKGCFGVVVATTVDDKALRYYPKNDCSDMGEGYMILTNEIGLSYYDIDDQEIFYIGSYYGEFNQLPEKVHYEKYLNDLIDGYRKTNCNSKK